MRRRRGGDPDRFSVNAGRLVTAMWWMKVLLVGFGIAWLVLLVDCLRRERFFPVLGPGIRTKVLWLVTFFLFSPIQIVLYLLFGRLLRPREHAPTWARVGILALVIAAAGLQIIPIGSGVSGPFSLVRDAATGKLLRQGTPDPLRLDLNASVLSSESNSSSTSVVSNSDNASLMCRRLALVNLSDHPLMRRVGEEVARRVGEVPAVERVDYYPAGSSPPPGSRGPDLLLTLDLRSVDETNLPAYRQLEANVKVAAATDLWPGRISHTFDSTTPPVIEASWTLDLQHRSRMAGYESADARYKMAAEKIGEEIGGSLGKQLAGWQEKHGLLEDLPEAFYGPYREASDVPFAGERGCTPAMSSFGLFEHNRTVWLIDDPRETSVVLRELQVKLEAAGWKSRSQGSAAGSEAHVDMTTGYGSHVDLKHGARSLHMFRERGDDLLPDQASRRIVVLYREPVSDELRCAALSEWLDQQPSPEMLLRFERMAHSCSADLREQMGAQIEANPPATGQAHLSLARRYEGRGERDKAKSAVIRASLLARAAGNHGEIKGGLSQLAEKLGAGAGLISVSAGWSMP